MAAALHLDVDAPFELWAIDLSQEPQPDDVAILSGAERRRALRFRFGRDRRRYLNAHAALARLLNARCTSSAPNRTYMTNAFGKPRVCGEAGPHFSLSYADDMALIGVSNDHAIGVDVETLRPIELDDVTSDIFDTSESAAIAGVHAQSARSTAFFRAWTRKEACVKAVGTGLSTPPASIGVGITNDRRQVAVACNGVPMSVEVGSFRIGNRIAAWARVL